MTSRVPVSATPSSPEARRSRVAVRAVSVGLSALMSFTATACLLAACASHAQKLPMASVPVSATAPVAASASPPGVTSMLADKRPAPEPPVPVRATPDAPFRAQAPAPGPEPELKVPDVKRFKLKNGIDVILAEFHDLPLVELHLLVKTGGGANPPGLAGLADICANMLDEGTKTRTAIEIAEQLADLGAALASSSSWDASTVSLSTISRNFDASLAIWADVITHPTFADKELARLRENLLTAVSRRKDSPPTLASLALMRSLFGDRHPYAWPMTGVEESLQKITLADVRKFYATYYHPGNATVIAAGDVTEAELRAKLEPALKDWRPAKVPAVRIPAPAPITKQRIVLVDKPGAPQSSIRVGVIGARRTDPDYFPIIMMNQVLGGAFYRLDMNLRERRQWTYGARSIFDMRSTPGPLSAGGEFVAAHTTDAVAEILKEMHTIATTEVNDEEIGRAKDNFSKSFPARFATRGSIAGLLAELAVYGLPNSYLADYTKKIQAVTKADIRRVAQRFLLTDKKVIVVVGDRASNETPLGKLAPVELRDLDGNVVTAPKPAPAAGKAGAGGSGTGGD